MPRDDSTLESVVADILQQPRGMDILVDGDLNTYLESPDGQQRGKSADAVIEREGLEYMMEHFLPY